MQSVIVSGGVRAVLDVKLNATWRGRDNVYDVYAFSFGGTALRTDFAAFAGAASETGSRHEQVSEAAADQLAAGEAVFAGCGSQVRAREDEPSAVRDGE